MFELTIGRLVMTRAIHERMLTNSTFAVSICKSVERYAKGDWGELCDDKAENENTLKHGERISAYIKDVARKFI